MPAPLTLPQEAAQTRAKLDEPSRLTNLNLQNLTFENLILELQQQYQVFIRFDFAAMQRYRGLQAIETMLSPDVKLGETKVRASCIPSGLSLRDLLTEVLATTFPDAPLTLVVQGNQILITPAYIATRVPGLAGNPDGNQRVEHSIVVEMMNGPPVSTSFDNASLTEVIEMLRAKTGANIVVKLPKDGSELNNTITATLDNVRLATVLELVGDMVGLRLVVIGNVFYLTDVVSAERLQEKVNREMYGKSPTK